MAELLYKAEKHGDPLRGGDLYTFGRNLNGHLGHGDTREFQSPKQVSNMDGQQIAQVVMKKNHMLLLTSNTRGICKLIIGNAVTMTCGENMLGQKQAIPMPLPSLLTVKIIQIATGGNSIIGNIVTPRESLPCSCSPTSRCLLLGRKQIW
jgi:alpha-tubulin suppressor-like RCC1 family protein